MTSTTREQRGTARIGNSDVEEPIDVMGSLTFARGKFWSSKRRGHDSAHKVVPTIKYVDGDSSHAERGWISGWDTRDLVEVDACRTLN